MKPKKLIRVIVALALLVAAPSAAAASYVVSGAGFGHGVGMSQWGAYGYAKHGIGYRDIVTHYFKGAKLGQVKAGRTIRILLGADPDVKFSGSKRACGVDLRPGQTYRAALNGNAVRLEREDGSRLTGCGKSLVAKGVVGPIRIGGEGSYRGDFVAAVKGGTQYVVNELELDDYVKGVVPNEMPPQWPIDALRAQAVAARSYGIATDAGGRIFDQYDDSRSQGYGGLAVETGRTNRAVRTSSRKIVTYDGKVIPAYYSSSSGGRTENVEFAFGGASPAPYLKSVRDPYDGASPDHRWRETFTTAEMEEMLGGLVEGGFRGIAVTKRGVSPRIVAAKVLGSRGTTPVTGTDLRVRLGLRSTWAKFTRER